MFDLTGPIAGNALLLLRYLRERERHGELPEIPEISEVVGLTHDETSDLIDILDNDGSIKANRTIDGGAASRLTGHGKLRLASMSESVGKKDGQAHPVPKPETSPEPREFDHSPDYSTVNWRGQQFHFTAMQSRVVSLLHEEFQRGRNDLRDAYTIEEIEAKVRTLKGLFKKSDAWDKLIVSGEHKGTHRLNLPRKPPPDTR